MQRKIEKTHKTQQQTIKAQINKFPFFFSKFSASHPLSLLKNDNFTCLDLVSWRSPKLTCSIRYFSDCRNTREANTAVLLFRTLTFFSNLFFCSLGFVPSNLSSILKFLFLFSIERKKYRNTISFAISTFCGGWYAEAYKN